MPTSRRAVGGDEFAVLVTEDLSAPEVAVTVANRILAAIQPAIEAQGGSPQSAAASAWPSTAGPVSADVLLDEADRVLREGEAKGKNQVRVAFLEEQG